MVAKKIVRSTVHAAPKQVGKLDHLIPPKWMDEQYISREFNGGITDIDVYRYARKEKLNVLLYGPTGVGKTSSIYAYAAQDNIPVVVTSCHGAVDPATMFSRVVVGADGSIGYEPTDAVEVLLGGGIWLINEVNFLPPRIAAVTYSALDYRRTISIPELNLAGKLHEDTAIFADFNPEYEGTRELSEAFRNRFPIQLPFPYDAKVEKELITGIPTLLELAKRLRASFDNGDIETPVGPNVLLEFEQIAFQLNIDFAISNLVARFKAHESDAVKNAVEHFRSDMAAELKATTDIIEKEARG